MQYQFHHYLSLCKCPSLFQWEGSRRRVFGRKQSAMVMLVNHYLILFIMLIQLLINKLPISLNYLVYPSINKYSLIYLLSSNIKMRHFRVEEQSNEADKSEQKADYRLVLAKALKRILNLVPFAEFTVNYGYVIENVWITMLMIVHKTPPLIDSFVWIVPVILAAFFRPYVVKYIHQIDFKVYRQISVTSFCLIMGSLGCFIVGLSCDIPRAGKHSIFPQTMFRILICSIGWILMDVGFQFCLYFAQKIKESYEQLLQKQKEQDEKQENNQLFTQQNFAFYGLLVGYIVSALICWVIHGKSIKAFYKCAKYAYFTTGILAAITGLRLFIEGRLNLPRKSQSNKLQGKKDPLFILVTNVDFYLPGYRQLLHSNIHTISLLFVHFVIVFLNDVILIYTTMWFSDLKGAQFETQGEAYIYGLEVGSILLLLYTVIDNLQIRNEAFGNHYFLQLAFIVTAASALLAFYQYNFISFSLIIILVAVLNQFYRKTILITQKATNPLFDRCIQITERMQKIFAYSTFPFVVLMMLNRDDIPDSLVLSAVFLLIAIFAFLISKLSASNTQKTEAVKSQKKQ